VNTGKQVVSIANVRLASTAGPVILVEAGKPTWIPNVLFSEASLRGCVDYDPRMIEMFRSLEAGVTGEPSPTGPDQQGLAETAVRQVLIAAADSPELLATTTNLPRVPAVQAAFEAICANNGVEPEFKISRDIVTAIYERIAKTEDAGNPNPGVAVEHTDSGASLGGDLEGEEVGGNVNDMIERVVGIEE
jgi:hypothetical protein